MRIRDLLAAESIQLGGKATGKQDLLDQMVDLMAKSGKSMMWRHIEKVCTQERKKEQPESEKELPFRIANPMQSADQVLQPW